MKSLRWMVCLMAGFSTLPRRCRGSTQTCTASNRSAAGAARGAPRRAGRRWRRARPDGNLVSDARQGECVRSAKQGVDAHFRSARQAQGQPNWTEVVVHDHLFHGEYISMAAGAKTPRRFHQDHRVWWVVQSGQIRFTIEGQEPFVASKGFLVQVPKRLIYSLETVGDQPSLRFEVSNPASIVMYPADETPTPLPGIKYEGREWLPPKDRTTMRTFRTLITT